MLLSPTVRVIEALASGALAVERLADSAAGNVPDRETAKPLDKFVTHLLASVR